MFNFSIMPLDLEHIDVKIILKEYKNSLHM